VKLASSLAIAAALAFSSFAPDAALAAGSSPAAWVSGHGTNSSGCGSLTNPCLTLQYTHDNVVAAGGLIAVLDSSDYGPLVIRKAISIVDDGGLAGIAVASGDAIDIQAGPTDAVFLKGLHVDGLGTASNGIKLTSAGSLTVANCTVREFGLVNGVGSGNGIFITPASSPVSFNIFDTIISGNVAFGIFVFAGNSNAVGNVKHVTAINNGNVNSGVGGGLVAQGSAANVIVSDSNFSQNHLTGIWADGGQVSVSNSVATLNDGYDLDNLSGTLTSYQNNIYSVSYGVISPASLH
jgi:hypothetical protein